MVAQNEWMDRGHRAVGAATDLATGLFRGLQNIGPRIKAAQYKPVVEAFCAYTGLLAAQHGRLQRTEIDGFRNFLLQNGQHPVFGGFPLEELIDKFKNYAVRAFLDENQVFSEVLNPIARGSEEAHLIVAGCMSVIYADGNCDANEQTLLDQLSQRLGVDTTRMAQSMGIFLPSAPRTQSPTRAISSPPPPPPPPVATPNREPCSMCQGKGCVFCNQTGFKA
ncbi:MAG: TerB family tellurite resistance protein [Magnetococcales bacterium]|nr:TerB family tellurite resistance protein [Magnetococcales bacterium]